jgi:hypothetical protein
MLLLDVEEFGLDDQILAMDVISDGAEDFYIALGLAKGELLIKGFKKKIARTASDYSAIFSKRSKIFDEKYELFYPISCLQFFRDSVAVIQ